MVLCPFKEQLALDMNGDGLITITDIGHWLKTVFYMPGEIVVNTIDRVHPLSRFFELTSASCHGHIAVFLSGVVWGATALAISLMVAVSYIVLSSRP